MSKKDGGRLHNQEVTLVDRYKPTLTLDQQWSKTQMFEALREIWVKSRRIAPSWHTPV